MENPKHISIELAGCNPYLLSDCNVVGNYLSEAVDLLDMIPLGKPIIHQFVHPTNPQENGITGIQVITTSHISFHSYPETNSTYIDVFSCKDFNQDEIVRFTVKYFQAKIHWLNSMKRMNLEDVENVNKFIYKPNVS
jgi:S-adenosylmethionine/arginine decarboxylase-like enzyme